MKAKNYFLIMLITFAIIGAALAAVGPREDTATASTRGTGTTEGGAESTGTGEMESSQGDSPGEPMLISANPAGFMCSEEATMRDRVRCRTRLAAENENDYLPEECRAMEGDDRGHCVEDYRKVRSCWDLRGTRDRVACVRQNLGAPEDLQKEKVSCDEKLDSEKDACLNNLKAKAYGVIKFRFYNLEERAERLKEMDVKDEWEAFKEQARTQVSAQ